MKICPVCEEPVERHGGVPRKGWALEVDSERLIWQHADLSALCPEMTSKGYQPSLPTNR